MSKSDLPDDKLLEDIKAEKPPQKRGSRKSKEEASLFNAEKGRHDLEFAKLERGWLGRVFGGGSGRGANIAGLVVIFAFITLLLSFFVTPSGDMEKIRTGLFGLILSALSYSYGASRD